MSGGLLALCTTAVSIGVIHTLLGPDHYLPFVALARSRKWSMGLTVMVTTLCGIGHVLGSVLLGTVGVLAGIMVGKIETFDAFRGELAAMLLLVFGTIYMFWGLWKFFYPSEHRHALLHRVGIGHQHLHPHGSGQKVAGGRGEASSAIDAAESTSNSAGKTSWVLFIIFVLGPCEPLIPLLMYPASESNFAGMLVVALVFSIATIGTMLAVVLALHAGLKSFKLGLFERLSHFIAGLAVALCGAAILFLGL